MSFHSEKLRRDKTQKSKWDTYDLTIITNILHDILVIKNSVNEFLDMKLGREFLSYDLHVWMCKRNEGAAIVLVDHCNAIAIVSRKQTRDIRVHVFGLKVLAWKG